METPKISVCQPLVGKGFNIGCFDGFDCVREFKRYEDEETGIEECKTFFKEKGIEDPVIVRPKITKMILK